MPRKNQNKQAKAGFTIIEVVLVLAIAGLIFLMVFVALPALQRSQRDTARRNDLSRVDTSLVQYQTNNQGTGNGNLPAASSWTATENFEGDNACKTDAYACRFVREYMNSGAGNATKNEFQDPDGTYYSLDIGSGAFTYDENGMDHTIYIRTGAKCNGSVAEEDTARHFAILYRLEGAGVYCIDDQ